MELTCNDKYIGCVEMVASLNYTWLSVGDITVHTKFLLKYQPIKCYVHIVIVLCYLE